MGSYGLVDRALGKKIYFSKMYTPVQNDCFRSEAVIYTGWLIMFDDPSHPLSLLLLNNCNHLCTCRAFTYIDKYILRIPYVHLNIKEIFKLKVNKVNFTKQLSYCKALL